MRMLQLASPVYQQRQEAIKVSGICGSAVLPGVARPNSSCQGIFPGSVSALRTVVQGSPDII